LKSILKTTPKENEAPSKLGRQVSSKVSGSKLGSTSQSEKVEKKDKKSRDSKSTKPVPETEAHNDAAEDEDSADDDRTEAFLKGFESGGDEEAAKTKGGLVLGEDVPKVPTPSKKEQKRMKRLAEAKEAENPGVIYIGRIPHGFYEQEMRAYFEQFGKILRLRLSRNRKTGASKHHAWVEFESATVADVVAKTMDNYLLFNHILKVRVVPDEQVPEALFKGANRRFKKVPWNKIEGRKLKQPATEEVWERRVAKEQRRREEKAEKLKQLGYEFEAPSLKSVVGLAQKAKAPLLLTLVDGKELVKAEERRMELVEEDGLQSKKSKTLIGDFNEQGISAVNAPMEMESEGKQPKQEKKRKAGEVEEGKRSKKQTRVVVDETDVVGKHGKVSKKAKKQKVEAISGA